MRTLLISSLSLLLAFGLSAQKKTEPSQTDLDAITARGRLLAEYDTASWHATDAVQALKPPAGVVGRYIARKTESGWEVAFGRMNGTGDGFLIAYEATQGTSLEVFAVKTLDPPRMDTGFYLNAERAIETALKDFQRQQRPYNVSVLPTDGGQMYVYIYPGSTVTGVYLVGGDARYLMSADGAAVVEKRQLHKTIIQFLSDGKVKSVKAGYHTHVLSDLPEDTDVLYVLTRKPPVPEYVSSMSGVIYVINVDGTISKAK